MRRPIFVYGCTLENGDVVTTEEEDIVAIKVFPDKSVHLTRPDQTIHIILDAKWVSYIPRFN